MISCLSFIPDCPEFSGRNRRFLNTILDTGKRCRLYRHLPLLAATVIKPALSVFSRPTDSACRNCPEMDGTDFTGGYPQKPPDNRRQTIGPLPANGLDQSVTEMSVFPFQVMTGLSRYPFTMEAFVWPAAVFIKEFASSSSVPGVTTMIFSASAVSAALIRASIVHFA